MWSKKVTHSRVTQSISPLRSHRTVRLPVYKSQMYCYIMDVAIASVGITQVVPYFLFQHLMAAFLDRRFPILLTLYIQPTATYENKNTSTSNQFW